MIGCGGDNKPIKILCGGAWRGVQRCAEGCVEVHGGGGKKIRILC